ncbi:MAG: CRTAC1 family protein, partial [Nitrospirota bacterium]|nr:CRTAC1 family protein [Nitrospirota bacterium]
MYSCTKFICDHVKRLAFIFCLLPAVRSHAQFSETSTANGIFLVNDNPLFGNGTCFVDFDDDGWDDLTFASKNQSVLFYKNNNGQFTPYFPTFDPQLPATGDIKCVLWVDYDNDGDKDFILSAVYATLKVYQNQGDMTFIEVGSQIGILPETVQIYGVSAGDIDNDGCLDLFVCKYHNHQLVTGYQYSNRVYHNNCDGTFSDVTVSAGFGTSIQASFACIWLDYNMDGYQDVYVINDRLNYPNFLYKNNGNGGFINVTASSGAGVYIEAMSCSSTDYDNDGDLDIYVSNTSAGNVLLNNNLGLQIFTDVASSAGVVANQLCWGALWIDYNNDMWEDLFVSTLGNVGTTLLQNLFFVSDGDGTFHSGISETGILGDTDGSYTVAKGDYNQDGYYDYATNNASPASASLWQNNGGSNHWISVSLEGTISNKDGIGSWIECFVDGNKYVQYTFCGENYLGQNSEREIFGLAGNTAVDSLRIKWLSGIVETYYSPEID